MSADSSAPAVNWMPPHRVLRDFLDAPTAAALLDHARTHEADFTQTGLARGGKTPTTDLMVRKSLALRNLAGFRPLLETLILARAPELMAGLGMSPVATSSFETELVAHGDGAFYHRHIDTLTDEERKNIRVLSGVYYLHRTPKAFSGGALRLYSLRDANRFTDIPPTHNTLLLFPSWAPHEVLPVRCPSQQFMDSRFAVNCWVCAPARPRQQSLPKPPRSTP